MNVIISNPCTWEGTENDVKAALKMSKDMLTTVGMWPELSRLPVQLTSSPYLPTVTAFLNADLDNFSDWCDENDMKNNTSKSKAMFLARKYTANKIMEEPPYLAIIGEQIQISESEKQVFI